MAELPMLEGPYEIFDMEDGQSMRLDVLSYEEGQMDIKPRRLGGETVVRVRALRVHVKEGTKPFTPMYWDITAQTLIAYLLPFFRERDFERAAYKVTKHGVAPKARFTVERIPL